MARRPTHKRKAVIPVCFRDSSSEAVSSVKSSKGSKNLTNKQSEKSIAKSRN